MLRLLLNPRVELQVHQRCGHSLSLSLNHSHTHTRTHSLTHARTHTHTHTHRLNFLFALLWTMESRKRASNHLSILHFLDILLFLIFCVCVCFVSYLVSLFFFHLANLLFFSSVDPSVLCTVISTLNVDRNIGAEFSRKILTITRRHFT